MGPSINLDNRRNKIIAASLVIVVALALAVVGFIVSSRTDDGEAAPLKLDNPTYVVTRSVSLLRAAPVVDFTYSPSAPVVGQQVSFTCTTATGTTCYWDRNVNQISDYAANPSTHYNFTYTTAGTKTMCVQSVNASSLRSPWICHNVVVKTATTTTAPTTTSGTTTSTTPPSNLGTALTPRMPESSGTQTLIVSPSGSGSSSCTLATPCSVNHAWSIATSGTIIQLRGNAGNYSGQLFVAGKSYSASNPVTMMTYPGDSIATFVGANTTPEKALSFEGDQGIRLRNFKVSAPVESGINIEESWHIELDGLRLIGNGSSCTTSQTFQQCGGTGVLVQGGNPGYFTYYSADIQIWNSVFANNGGTSTYATVGCCDSASNHDHAMYLGGGNSSTNETGFRSMTVANNLIFDEHNGFPVQIGQSGRGLIFTNNTIQNVSNTDNPCAVVLWGTGAWADSNDLFVNNLISTVNGSGSNAFCTVIGKNLSGNHVRNNMASGVSTAYAPTYGGFTGFDCGATCPGQNYSNADPLFVDTSGTYADLSTKDFHLQSGSPAKGKGDGTYTPPYDHDGNARSQTVLGAYN